jgi:hypothetical protein
MIKKLERSSGKVYGVEVSGTLTVEEYREYEPEIEAIIEKEGNINVLVIVKDLPSVGIREVIEDFRFAMKHWGDWNRIAIVGEMKALNIVAKIENLFIKGQERYYDISQLEEAWKWVEEK